MDKKFTRSQIDQIAGDLLAESSSRLICFYGEMGAGKTTLIKSLLSQLGAAQSGSSPTFGIVNEYLDGDGKSLAYHFDFYRIEEETEALDLGIEEYFDSPNWVFVEWPEKIKSLLPKDCQAVQLEILGTEQRRIHFI